MKIKLLPYEAALKLSRLMEFKNPLFSIPNYLFGKTFYAEPTKDPNIYKLDDGGIHWFIPVVFIAEIIP